MSMLIQTLHQASANPDSWIIVGLIAAVALFSVYKWRACPYLCHTKSISLDESLRQQDHPFAAGPRFVLVMSAGIAAILIGLSLVSQQVNPLLALLLIVAGVFAVHFEPALLGMQDSVRRVVSAQCQGPEAVAAAEERLRYAHIWLVGANFILLIAVVLVLLAF
jgi:hypothetical protein